MAGRHTVTSKMTDGRGNVIKEWTLEDFSPNDADHAWVERELGDVPTRTPGNALADAGFPALGALVDAFRMRD